MIYDPLTDLTLVVYTNAWNMRTALTSIAYQITNMLQNVCYRSKELMTRH